MRTWAWLWLGLVGCTGDGKGSGTDDTHDPVDTDTLATDPEGQDPLGSSTVGAAGGELELPGLAVVVPTGALSGDTEITVAELTDTSELDFEGETFFLDNALTPVYVFGPSGLTFDTPVQVTFSELSLDDGWQYRVMWSSDGVDWDYFTEEDFVDFSYAGSSITVEVDHFSFGFVYGWEPDQDSGDVDDSDNQEEQDCPVLQGYSTLEAGPFGMFILKDDYGVGFHADADVRLVDGDGNTYDTERWMSEDLLTLWVSPIEPTPGGSYELQLYQEGCSTSYAVTVNTLVPPAAEEELLNKSYVFRVGSDANGHDVGPLGSRFAWPAPTTKVPALTVREDMSVWLDWLNVDGDLQDDCIPTEEVGDGVDVWGNTGSVVLVDADFTDGSARSIFFRSYLYSEGLEPLAGVLYLPALRLTVTGLLTGVDLWSVRVEEVVDMRIGDWATLYEDAHSACVMLESVLNARCEPCMDGVEACLSFDYVNMDIVAEDFSDRLEVVDGFACPTP